MNPCNSGVPGSPEAVGEGVDVEEADDSVDVALLLERAEEVGATVVVEGEEEEEAEGDAEEEVAVDEEALVASCLAATAVGPGRASTCEARIDSSATRHSSSALDESCMVLSAGELSPNRWQREKKGSPVNARPGGKRQRRRLYNVVRLSGAWRAGGGREKGCGERLSGEWAGQCSQGLRKKSGCESCSTRQRERGDAREDAA